MRRTRSRALRAASRARAASTALPMIRLRDGRVLLEIRAELVVDDRLDDALDLGVAELRLGLAFELRLRDLDADDRRSGPSRMSSPLMLASLRSFARLFSLA